MCVPVLLIRVSLLELFVRPSFNNEYGGSFVLIEPGQNGDLVVEEPFFIGARPVTQVEWSAVMGSNPSKFQDGWSAGLRPVESVSWLDCQAFIAKLNEEETEQRLGLSGIWRLPNATEWEYACRAGSETRWYHSDRDKDLDEVAWHAGNAGATTREVGQKRKMNGVCMIATVMWLNGLIVEMIIAVSPKVGHG